MPLVDYHALGSNSLENETFHLKETMLGTYKEIKMLALKSSSTPTEQKLRIIQEFKLSEEDISEELGVEEYYKELFLALFLEAGKFRSVSPDYLNIGVINKALQDFFTRLKGN